MSTLRAQLEAAERELRDRELHHFEAEAAMTEALAMLDGNRPDLASGILRAALGHEPTEQGDMLA